eukprot:932022_1
MLRIVSKRAVSQIRNSSRALSSAVAQAPAGPPSVLDNIVNLNFVDPSGARRQVPGYIGKTIYETCEMHGIDLGPASVGAPVEAVRSDTWTEPLYGEGPTSGYDHILLVGKGAETAKPMTHIEKKVLTQYWDEDEIFPESRLATEVSITKEMDGMTVYVPDRIIDDIP